MEKVSTVGLDIAKQVFQVHGADETGKVVLRKKLSRSKLLTFFAVHPSFCQTQIKTSQESQSSQHL